MEMVKVDMEYPNLDGITPDRCAAAIIAPAYAGLAGEMTAILTYVYHHINFDFEGYIEIADLLEEISITEMVHFELLGKALIKLGVLPILTEQPTCRSPFYNTSKVPQSCTPLKMLTDDIEGELNAIRDYRKMLCELKNEQVAALIARIILDEELHVERLKEAYNCLAMK